MAGSYWHSCCPFDHPPRCDAHLEPVCFTLPPRALLRSHAEYIEFCHSLLDDEGHQCWRDILTELGVADPRSWIRCAARFATLPPLPVQLALPAPLWSMVSSTVLMYLQPALLAALAGLMNWPHLPHTNSVGALHFSGYSAGSHTAIALEADYRLLCWHLQQPYCEGATLVRLAVQSAI